MRLVESASDRAELRRLKKVCKDGSEPIFAGENGDRMSLVFTVIDQPRAERFIQFLISQMFSRREGDLEKLNDFELVSGVSIEQISYTGLTEETTKEFFESVQGRLNEFMCGVSRDAERFLHGNKEKEN